MDILFWGALLGIIPAIIAKNKGRSAFGWWVFGALLFIVALPAILLASDLNKEKAIEAAQKKQATMRKCPFCAELIKKEAVKCKHCHENVIPEEDSKYTTSNNRINTTPLEELPNLKSAQVEQYQKYEDIVKFNK